MSHMGTPIGRSQFEWQQLGFSDRNNLASLQDNVYQEDCHNEPRREENLSPNFIISGSLVKLWLNAVDFNYFEKLDLIWKFHSQNE